VARGLERGSRTGAGGYRARDLRFPTRHLRAHRGYLLTIAHLLTMRGHDHDLSKLESPEREMFDVATPKLRELTYGSPEYKAMLGEMGAGLEHHYAGNDHHPEHFPDGIAGMGLLQLTEMLCDWQAATLRHEDGDLAKSIEQNQARFGYGDEIKALLVNTATELWWLADG
jgi:hypothetical protein